MKYKSIIYFVFSLLILVFTVVFAISKNSQNKEFKIALEYSKKPLFLNDSVVNKLLTQNLLLTSKKHKDSLVLNEVEAVLEDHKVIENAEAYLKPSGILGINITEREPFFLVEDTIKYFVDRKAKRFPYKSQYGNDLPTFSGFLSVEKREEVIHFLTQIQRDPFMAIEFNGLYFKDGKYYLKMRSFPFNVVLGSLNKMEHKMEKLKIFCAYQRAQDTLVGFNEINVQYANQVVALTPKEL